MEIMLIKAIMITVMMINIFKFMAVIFVKAAIKVMKKMKKRKKKNKL